MPQFFIDLAKQSKNPVYGNTPSLFFFILMNLVFTLSNGREIKETLTPDKAEAVNLIVIVYCFQPVIFRSSSFASLYETNWDELTAIARQIVGTAPVQSPLIPSSLPILVKASSTFLQFRLYYFGRLLSDWNLIKATSVGLAMADPIAPENKEYCIFYENERFRFSFNLTLSYKALQIPSLMPQYMN